MNQLKMRWFRQEPKKVCLPEEMFVRSMNGSDSDIKAWLDIMNEAIYEEPQTKEAFIKNMVNRPGFCMETAFVLEWLGEIIASITAIVHSNQEGYVHMVGCKREYRGRGIGAILNNIALNVFYERGCPSAYLTTDDFRIPAIKSYLNAGFLPELYEEDMRERWRRIMEKIHLDKITVIDENQHKSVLML